MGGPMPIPVSEITAWCSLRKIEDVDERMELLSHIRAMDGEYLNHAQSHDQSEAEHAAGAS